MRYSLFRKAKPGDIDYWFERWVLRHTTMAGAVGAVITAAGFAVNASGAPWVIGGLLTLVGGYMLGRAVRYAVAKDKSG